MGVPQVDFYILAGSVDAVRLKFACGIIEQAFLDGRRVLAWTDDAPQLDALDDLLWTFADRSFVPHEKLATDATSEAPVALVAGASPLPAGYDVLVNLGSRSAPADVAIERIVEIVDADDTRRRQGRERFREYRERGWTQQHHNIASET
ncbi:MAG: DNA polymerase III subunit chi [Proteobacteria bacterium]|nr:MAG: DNA polymerase III subunit chi [Pseudomonadota bacterium]